MYDPRSVDNEERSATWARTALSRAGASPATADAVRAMMAERFKAADKDDDGKLNKEELGAMIQAGPMSGRSRDGSGERLRQGRPQRPSQ